MNFRVYLSLGSNLADPINQVRNALDLLSAIPKTQRAEISAFYRTSPYGLLNQPDYLNAAVALDTRLSPEAFLEYTQKIELEQGRVRTEKRWGPRTLDLDIMLFGNLLLSTQRLTVPHYDMLNRAFMLVPLLEIAPQIRLPHGLYLTDVVRKLDCSIIQPW